MCDRLEADCMMLGIIDLERLCQDLGLGEERTLQIRTLDVFYNLAITYRMDQRRRHRSSLLGNY